MTNVRNDFAVFVLSHGRADSVLTIDALHRAGYTGKWFIIIDDEDDQAETYFANFGKEHVFIFSKVEVGKQFDIMDNFTGRQVPTFARNVLYEFANQLGLKYFFESDDDLVRFRQRYLNEDGKLCTRYVTDMDSIMTAYLDYMDTVPIDVLAFAQTGDLIGGKDSKMFSQKYRRKAMQGFFVRVDHPFSYIGRFNDDVNAYVEYGKQGYLFLTFRDIVMDTPETQVRRGGIFDAYAKYGTYVKSFYSVMLCPSSVFIDVMGVNHRRIHHSIDWDRAVPKIVSSTFKKGELI